MISKRLQYELPEVLRDEGEWTGVRVHLLKKVIDRVIENTGLTSSKIYRLLTKYFDEINRISDYTAYDGSQFYLVKGDSDIEDIIAYCNMNRNTRINAIRNMYSFIAGPKLKNVYGRNIKYTYCYTCRYRGDSGNCESMKHPTLSFCDVGKSILKHKDGSYYYRDLCKEHKELLSKNSEGSCIEDDLHYVKPFLKMESQ